MARHVNKLRSFYNKLVTSYKFITLTILFSLLYYSFLELPKFRLDASSDTLVLDGNKELEYYEKTKETYGSDNYLVITYSDKNGQEIITHNNIRRISKLHHEIEDLPNISSVISLVNAPLLNSPQISASQVEKGPIVTIENSNFSSYTDVKKELKTSPIYSDILLSKDGMTASLLIKLLESDTDSRQQDEQTISAIRTITEKYKQQAEIFMGGIPMITVDSINYIKNDIAVFGLAAIFLIAIFLLFSFKKAKWVVLPLLNSGFIIVFTTSLLAYLDWPVTVVSANFISLLLIISISLSIHYIVHYEELINREKYLTHTEIILKAASEKFAPCFYTALTTIVAFSSLIISNIKPVESFGFMMTIGITIAFIVTFLFIPTILTFLNKQEKQDISSSLHNKVASFLCILLEKQKIILILFFLLLTGASIYGMTKLSVDNRFIDYYKKHTEIYQGMELIDQKLGGTTPLEIIIDAPQEFLTDEYSSKEDYWYNSFILDDIAAIQNYLENLPEVGKTLSIASSIESLKPLNNGQIDSFFLALVKQKASDNVKDILFSPYISEDGNQIRIVARIYESKGNLKRQDLINNIRQKLTTDFYISEEDLHITGMLVLYNDMLQSLFKSQIMTLSAVFLAIAAMLAIVFKNLKIAFIALIPNIVSAIAVLGFMGLFNISLDIMTITIAAITVGISVDDTIHYLHRYLDERAKGKDTKAAIIASHNSIGRALYLTTFTIAIGFIILTASNFVPTIYFGLLTALAMIIALVADLLLLPLLLLSLKK